MPTKANDSKSGQMDPSPYALVDPHTGTPYCLMYGTNNIGRGDTAVPPKDPSFINLYTPRAGVSREHATITIAPNDDAWLEDTGSTNGTMVAIREGEGIRLTPKRYYQLSDGTRIVFGEVEVVFVHLGSVSQHQSYPGGTASAHNSPADFAPKVSTNLVRTESTGQQIASLIGQRCAEHQRAFSYAFLSPSSSEAALVAAAAAAQVASRPSVVNPHSPLAPPSFASSPQPSKSHVTIDAQVTSPRNKPLKSKGSSSNQKSNAEGEVAMPEAIPPISRLEEQLKLGVASPPKVSQNGTIPPTLVVGEEAGLEVIAPLYTGVAIPYLDDEDGDDNAEKRAVSLVPEPPMPAAKSKPEAEETSAPRRTRGKKSSREGLEDPPDEKAAESLTKEAPKERLTKNKTKATAAPPPAPLETAAGEASVNPSAAKKSRGDKSPPKKNPRIDHETEANIASDSSVWEWPAAKKVVACLSGMDVMEKDKVSARITFLGGDVSDDWSPKVNLLVVGNEPASRTPKFLMALGRGVPVVQASLFFLDKAALAKRGLHDADIPSLLAHTSILKEFTPPFTHTSGNREASDIYKTITRNFALSKQSTKRPFAGCLTGLTFSAVAIPAKARSVVSEIIVGCGGVVAKTKKDEERLLSKASAATSFVLTTTEHVECVYTYILDGSSKLVLS